MIENGNDVLDKELDVVELLVTVRQMKTFIQKNFIDWKKLKTSIPRDEAKRVLKVDGEGSKPIYRIKRKQSGITFKGINPNKKLSNNRLPPQKKKQLSRNKSAECNKPSKSLNSSESFCTISSENE